MTFPNSLMENGRYTLRLIHGKRNSWISYEMSRLRFTSFYSSDTSKQRSNFLCLAWRRSATMWYIFSASIFLLSQSYPRSSFANQPDYPNRQKFYACLITRCARRNGDGSCEIRQINLSQFTPSRSMFSRSFSTSWSIIGLFCRAIASCRKRSLAKQ